MKTFAERIVMALNPDKADVEDTVVNALIEERIRPLIIDKCAKVAEDILHQNIDNADCYKMGWEIVNAIKALKEEEEK